MLDNLTGDANDEIKGVSPREETKGISPRVKVPIEKIPEPKKKPKAVIDES